MTSIARNGADDAAIAYRVSSESTQTSDTAAPRSRRRRRKSTPTGFLANTRGTTWVHRADPRVKLLFIVSITSMSLMFLSPLYLAGVLALTVPLWASARVDLRPLKGPLWGIGISLLGMLIFIFLSSSLSYSGTPPWHLGPIALYPESLRNGSAQLFRMGIPMVTGLLIFTTTDPTDFSRVINRLHVPRQISFMLVTALRLFPLALTEFTNITQAQRLRGVTFTGPVNRVKAVTRTSLPLLIILLKKAQDMGIAVESRAFGAGRWNGAYKILRMSRADYVFGALTLAALLATIYVRFVLRLGWMEGLI